MLINVFFTNLPFFNQTFGDFFKIKKNQLIWQILWEKSLNFKYPKIKFKKNLNHDHFK